MQLEGSCHCGAVYFRLNSSAPYPYQRCYCSICRKTQGGGGYATNVGGDSKSMHVTGRESVSIYHAKIRNPGEPELPSTAERHFCKCCGSALWLYSPEWPEMIFPFASAIDTPLPVPPEITHMMVGSKAPWVEIDRKPDDKEFEEYPEESLADWHARLKLAR